MDAQQLLLKHFEKVILLVFVAWLGMTVAGLASQPAALQKAADVDTHLAKVSEHMGKSTVPDPKEPPWESNLRKQLDPASVPAAVPFPTWVMERRPAFLYQVEIDEPDYKPQHRPPTCEAVVADRGKIKVTWDPSSENLYIVTSFEVHRKVGDEEKWDKVAGPLNVDPNTHKGEWIDDKISSRKKYSYKVVSVATIDAQDPVVDQHKLVLPDEERLTESGVAGPVQTKQEFMILPMQGTHKVTEADLIKDEKAVSTLVVKVKKWDTTTNAWDEKTYFNLKIGDKIGKPEKIKKREVDFTTGAEVADIDERKRKSKKGDFDETVFVVKVKWPDGQTEEFTSKDEEDAKEAEKAAEKPPGGN